jgi:outer membrane protein assembly factor BamD
MKIRPLRLILWIAVLWVAGMGCRSEFERTRMSGNTELILNKALEYYEEEDWVKAQTLFELVLNQYRGRPEAEVIYFKYAYTYYNLQQYALSAHYFANFAQTYAYSPFREEADFMSAYSNYQMSPVFRLDQIATEEAIEGFQAFVNTYPNSDRVAECNELINEMREKLEQKAFSSAQLYYRMSDYQSAIHSFENLLTEYPDSKQAEEVQYLLVESSYNYAAKSIFEKREERYEETIEQYQDFVERYPSSMYREKVNDIYDKTLEQLKSLNE